MKKRTKRFDDGGMTDQDVASFAGTPENDSNAGMAEARDKADAEARGEAILKGMRDQAAAPKQRVVSKEELAKSGLSLRDFLNKERGLTRRGGAAPTPSAPVPTARPTAQPVGNAKAAYETPYDRMNRQNREASAAKEATAEETRRLANRVPPRGRGVINTSNLDSNTLLPKRSGYSKGGSVSKASSRADGIAQRGKTKGRMI